MNIDNLDQKLSDILQEYSKRMRVYYKEDSKIPATEADIAEYARQTFYTLDDFRKAIIEFLKEQN